MKKGCAYWLFIGFWLEPMILIFKISFYIMKELICAIINGILIFASTKNKYNNINFDLLDGHEFEYFCADLLRDNGFTGVKVTQETGDHGIDILANKDGLQYAIQCKRYSKNIGNKAVQEAYSGKDLYGANIGVVITNQYFTKQAQMDARSLGVQLWDRNRLQNLIKNAEKNKRSKNNHKNGKSMPNNLEENEVVREKIYNANNTVIQYSIDKNKKMSILLLNDEDIIELSCVFFYLYIELGKKKQKANYKLDYSISTTHCGKTAICENEYIYGNNIDGSISRTVPDWLEKARQNLLEIGIENYSVVVEKTEDSLNDFMNNNVEEKNKKLNIRRNQYINAKEIDVEKEEKIEVGCKHEKMNETPIYHFPTIELLLKPNLLNISEVKLKETAEKIQKALSFYGIQVSITDISVGARFTRYEIVPDMGTKIKDIVKRKEDIELNIATTGIHIEAPIQGKSAIGIDVPNKTVNTVRIREIIESKEFIECSSGLTIAIGKNMYGKTVVFDITKMPHLLIGGYTGSGKTVFINSAIMSILYKSAPEEVKMIFIDTKAINLSMYNRIPHLLIPVVTDAAKALSALHWILLEVQDRYRKFAECKVQNLKAYNINAERMGNESKIPQILIVIDDFADLMAVNSTETEKLIAELTRLSRGVGIHLIISTQRPSADVITGLIKSNIPSRIAFKVFSAIDSRIILDENGADELLGNGDMLFKPQGCMKPMRIQSAYVSDKEILNVVDFLSEQSANSKVDFYTVKDGKGNVETKAYDEYFEEAGRFVIDKGKASIGMLQRFFKVGFNRANEIMNQLCEVGVVGEELGTKPREVLMTLEQFEEFLEENI